MDSRLLTDKATNCFLPDMPSELPKLHPPVQLDFAITSNPSTGWGYKKKTPQQPTTNCNKSSFRS